jgi:hypothetical protein
MILIESTTTLQGLMNGAGITASIREDWNDDAPDWGHDKRHFRVRVRYQGRSMSVWYYQGLGNAREPRPVDILECLISDSSMDYSSLDDFISEMGLEIKSVSDFRTYERQFKQLNRQNKSFTRVIGNPELIETMREATYE